MTKPIAKHSLSLSLGNKYSSTLIASWLHFASLRHSITRPQVGFFSLFSHIMNTILQHASGSSRCFCSTISSVVPSSSRSAAIQKCCHLAANAGSRRTHSSRSVGLLSRSKTRSTWDEKYVHVTIDVCLNTLELTSTHHVDRWFLPIRLSSCIKGRGCSVCVIANPPIYCQFFPCTLHIAHYCVIINKHLITQSIT